MRRTASQPQVVNLHPWNVRARAAQQAYKRNLAHIKRDRGYRFTDRDQVLDEITKMISDSGKSIGDIIEDVLDVSNNSVNISYNTIMRWMNGTTRRPQNFTVTWVGYALGYTRAWTKRNS